MESNTMCDTSSRYCYSNRSNRNFYIEEMSMGMSSWILQIEETFWDQVAEIVKDSEHVSEAMERAVSLSKPMVPHIDAETIEESVGEMWNEFWSAYV